MCSYDMYSKYMNEWAKFRNHITILNEMIYDVVIVCFFFFFVICCFFLQAEDGIRDLVRSRGLGDVYKRQGSKH